MLKQTVFRMKYTPEGDRTIFTIFTRKKKKKKETRGSPDKQWRSRLKGQSTNPLEVKANCPVFFFSFLRGNNYARRHKTSLSRDLEVARSAKTFIGHVIQQTEWFRINIDVIADKVAR